jgi:hypothetical protein
MGIFDNNHFHQTRRLFLYRPPTTFGNGPVLRAHPFLTSILRAFLASGFFGSTTLSAMESLLDLVTNATFGGLHRPLRCLGLTLFHLDGLFLARHLIISKSLGKNVDTIRDRVSQ